jgi:hypothetical protein
MKKIVILALLLVFASPAFADSRCNDWPGNIGCRNETGNTWRGHTDSFGNEVWSDNRGNTVRGYTDSFGNKTYYDNRGRTIRCYTDSFGTTTCR